MQRNAVIIVVFAYLLARCHLPIGDRVIQVKASVISGSQAPISGCRLDLVSGDMQTVLDSAPDMRPQFLSSFINPPDKGSYYFKITCPNHQDSFLSAKYNFATGPYLHDLGVVVIAR